MASTVKYRDNQWVGAKLGGTRDLYPPAAEEEFLPILEPFHKWIESNKTRLEDHLGWYLTYYKGRFFEELRAASEGPYFTIFDIAAAETLSIKIQPRTVNWLTRPDEKRDDLVDQIFAELTPGCNTLWSCAPGLLRGKLDHPNESGPLFNLYYCLRENNIGRVTASKLLASKFPDVVPIRDSKIEKLFRLKNSDNWWLVCRHVFDVGGSEFVSYLNELEVPDGSSELSTVRRLDIILWMEALARGF